MSKEWNPNTMGHGKHDFRAIDPSTINPDDYAKKLHGEEEAFGDVREYNSAYNQKHPENDLGLDWLGRINTTFETEAVGFEGSWMVTNQPIVSKSVVYVRATRLDPTGEPQGDEVQISSIELGSAQDPADNLFRQIKSKILKKGVVNRTQRVRLTKKV